MTEPFKAGDKVRVKMGLTSGYQPGGSFISEAMVRLGGKTIILGKRCSVTGLYDWNSTDSGEWTWRECWLEPLPAPTDAELAAAYRASMTESRRLFVELEKRGYTIEAMFEGSRRKLRTTDSDTRYITKSEIKRVEL